MQLTETLRRERTLSDEGFRYLIESETAGAPLAEAADAVRRHVYGTDVYIRGLIELTNYCRNNCYYCGIRAGNTALERYRLTKDDILACSREGYALGFRTFVLQGGEDPRLTDAFLTDVVRSLKAEHPDCAVTLSVGERSAESYSRLREAGADRYLLRHETATDEHYRRLHPDSMSLQNRKTCLWELKRLGFQVGSGFMVGSPWQTTDNLIADLRFLEQLQPDMIGIGPFLHHADTPFAGFPDGDFERTVRLISILRLMFPYALIPATTALGTIRPDGRERGLAAGANVVMPNLSPSDVRRLYTLYDNKIATGAEGSEGLGSLRRRIADAGYRVVTDVGNARRTADCT
ncbi:MAG: [FeFe] hydrogenase H-cluster radical SAM maturase HydE [Clostridia bacterium]|nr:[FeFe] hydrogenase H-cluster radical SAM maturase HydE [Clostridia bacterium]